MLDCAALQDDEGPGDASSRQMQIFDINEPLNRRVDGVPLDGAPGNCCASLPKRFRNLPWRCSVAVHPLQRETLIRIIFLATLLLLAALLANCTPRPRAESPRAGSAAGAPLPFLIEQPPAACPVA